MSTAAATLRLRHVEPALVDVLGPGRRAVVWVQGCTRRCPGCIAPEMWPAEGGRLVDPTALAAELLAQPDVVGLTVSGGEPTEQAAGVAALLAVAKRAGRNTWVYSGYSLEELLARDDPDTLALLSAADVLVDGRYDEPRAAPLRFRGSANQRILHLTAAIPASAAEQAASARIEVALDAEGHLVVIGIPPPGTLARLREALRARGVQVTTETRWR